MADDRPHPAPTVFAAIGREANRFLQHRTRRQVFGAFDVEPAAHVAAHGQGRGQTLHFSDEAAVQLAIALPLIDCGVAVEKGYLIAARFAYEGQGAPAAWGGNPPPAPDPAKYRAPARLFVEGRTWLIAHVDGKADVSSFAYFSDADPDYASDARGTALKKARRAVGAPVDGAPRLLLDVSDICFRLARGLDLNPFTAFHTELANA